LPSQGRMSYATPLNQLRSWMIKPHCTICGEPLTATEEIHE